MKKATIITVILLLAASAAVFAQRHGDGFRGRGDCLPGGGFGHKGHGPGQQGMLLQFADKLELTDAQVKEIQDLHFKHRQAMIDVQASLKKARLNEHQEMLSDNPDKATILSFTREVNRIKGQMAEMRVEHRFAVHGVLNAEQTAKLKELRKSRPGPGSDDQFGPGRRGNKGGRGRMGNGPGSDDSYGMRLRDGSCVSGQ